MSMKNQKVEIENNDFIRLPRSVAKAFLDDFLTFDEMVVLIWLWVHANPRFGRAMVSYEGLSNDFKCRYSKNQINKFMLGLKQKKLIWFTRQQGRKGSFFTDIQNYPLPNRSFRNIDHLFEGGDGGSSEVKKASSEAEVPAEVVSDWQKLQEAKKGLAEGFSMESRSRTGRSHNNDNENRNYKNEIEVDRSVGFKETDNRMLVRNFVPGSREEARCQQIAEYLGDKSMRYILSVLKKYSLDDIEYIYNEIKEKGESGKGKPIQNRGAYFNKRIQQMTEPAG